MFAPFTDGLPEPDAALLAKQTFLIHNELPHSFTAWKDALDLHGAEGALWRRG